MSSCPKCGRTLAYPLSDCRDGRCPFCYYKPDSDLADASDIGDANTGHENESEESETLLTSSQPDLDLDSFRQHIAFSLIPKKAQQAILGYIEDIGDPTIDRPSDEQALFLRHFSS